MIVMKSRARVCVYSVYTPPVTVVEIYIICGCNMQRGDLAKFRSRMDSYFFSYH